MRVFGAMLTGALLLVTVACGGDDDPKDETGGPSVCERGCVATLAAMCPVAPPDQQSCVSTCQELSNGPCKTEYAAFQTCADGKPITCGSSGFPVVEECSAEQSAFIACAA
jgi:hypothetical protein